MNFIFVFNLVVVRYYSKASNCVRKHLKIVLKIKFISRWTDPKLSPIIKLLSDFFRRANVTIILSSFTTYGTFPVFFVFTNLIIFPLNFKVTIHKLKAVTVEFMAHCLRKTLNWFLFVMQIYKR